MSIDWTHIPDSLWNTADLGELPSEIVLEDLVFICKYTAALEEALWWSLFYRKFDEVNCSQCKDGHILDCEIEKCEKCQDMDSHRQDHHSVYSDHAKKKFRSWIKGYAGKLKLPEPCKVL